MDVMDAAFRRPFAEIAPFGNDGLGPEAGHGGASHVLDPRDDVADDAEKPGLFLFVHDGL